MGKSLWQKPPVVQRPPPNGAATGTTITTISNKSNCYSCQTRKKPNRKMPTYDLFQTFSIGLWLCVPKITIARLLFSQHVTGDRSKMFETNDCGSLTHISLVFLGFSTFLVLFVYSVIPFCTFLNLLIEIIYLAKQLSIPLVQFFTHLVVMHLTRIYIHTTPCTSRQPTRHMSYRVSRPSEPFRIFK